MNTYEIYKLTTLHNNKLNNPYKVYKNNIYINKDIVSNYNLKSNKYNELPKEEKFIVDKIILEYNIYKKITTINEHINKRTKEFNKIYLNKKSKSKKEREIKNELLNALESIIIFNKNQLKKYKSLFVLINDLTNDFILKDIITLKENINILKKEKNSLLFSLPINITENYYKYINNYIKTEEKENNFISENPFIEISVENDKRFKII